MLENIRKHLRITNKNKIN